MASIFLIGMPPRCSKSLLSNNSRIAVNFFALHRRARTFSLSPKSVATLNEHNLIIFTAFRGDDWRLKQVAAFFSGASLFSLGRRWGFRLSFFAPPGKRRSFCCCKKCQALNYINTICVRERTSAGTKICQNSAQISSSEGRRALPSRFSPISPLFCQFCSSVLIIL